MDELPALSTVTYRIFAGFPYLRLVLAFNTKGERENMNENMNGSSKLLENLLNTN